MPAETFKIDFTKRYVLALLLIAFLSSGAFFILHFALKTAESTALIVNISGKQRMLSQRVASLAQHYSSHVSHGNISDAKETKISLLKAIDEMQDANNRLSTGQINETVTFTPSAAINNLYFGKVDTKHRVDDYLRLANKLLISQNSDQYNEILHDLSMMSDALLVDLNEIVLQYQKEGEEKIAVIQNLELIAWIITLLTLLMEVIFIFQPMANTLRTLFQKEMWNKNYLEQEIQIRTYSLEQANEKLEYSASHDPLTGLNNRLNLEHELETLISHYRENRIPFAVLMLDIDWFKKVNDNYGHDMGDFVLKELAILIRGAIRSEDSAYRAGGEEFVIILNRISQAQAIEKAEALRHSIEEHSFVLGEIELNITISGGLYHPKWLEAMDLHEVLKLSDNALYEAKHLGRNRIVAAQTSSLELSSILSPSKTLIKVRGIRGETIVFADFDIIDLLGYSNDMLTEGIISLRDIVHPDDHDFFERLALRKPFMTTLRMLHANGNIKIIKAGCTPLKDDMWKIEMQDPILLAKSVEDTMIVQNFEAMMENTDDFIYFKDRYHVFTAGSHSLVHLTNVAIKEKLVGQTDYEVFSREYADKYFKLEKEVFSGGINVSREIQPILENNGRNGWVDNRKYPIKNKEGEIIGLFGIARIVSDLENFNGENYV